MKPRTTARGYGYAHQLERKRWAAVIAASGARCTRCRRLITAEMPWDLDHAPGKTGYLGPAHRRCNRRAGAKLGAAITNAKKRAKRRVSRQW
jgi:hypothetical protein